MIGNQKNKRDLEERKLPVVVDLSLFDWIARLERAEERSLLFVIWVEPTNIITTTIN